MVIFYSLENVTPQLIELLQKLYGLSDTSTTIPLHLLCNNSVIAGNSPLELFISFNNNQSLKNDFEISYDVYEILPTMQLVNNYVTFRNENIDILMKNVDSSNKNIELYFNGISYYLFFVLRIVKIIL